MPRWRALALCLALAVAAPAQVPPDKALATMQPGDGLQVSLFAAEPLLVNPTAIDVDHKGRVWVAEAVNYRRVNFKRPILREAGDRIVVLTDTDGDGKADKSEVFYQGTELYGPLSVLVLPQADGVAVRVLVAQSPDILEFWDRDGDGKADGPPTKFLTGFGGFDHDHGVHGLTTGPDGKLYFTVGDEGVKGLQSRDGKGRRWTTSRDPKSDCQAGTVWRCDLDGTNLELIAHNFRNNYEAAVDSFGEIWLSDNDDDGNQQTRICHVLPGGNYGYWPRSPGQSHWHEEQPGIVHKTLRTGFGSPTGICFYECSLLPEKFRGQLIHADAGPREIRSFKRKPKGAGYELDKTLMLTSTDTWFRPSDVCVAPDGSVFVADWYDPGVGGHGMGDWTRGRIYRLTPAGHTGYAVPAVDVVSRGGTLAALASPNTCIRAVAHAVLRKDGPLAADVVNEMVASQVAAVRSAGRLFAGSQLGWPVAVAVGPQKSDVADPKELEAHLRSLTYPTSLDRQLQLGFAPGSPKATQTQFAGFRREMAILHSRSATEYMREHFFSLAKLYDGDPTYRAALNIACGTDPARRDAILADFDKHFPEWNDRVADLAWELRPKSVLSRLDTLLADPKLTAAQKARLVDILAVSDSPDAGAKTLALLAGDAAPAVKARAADNLAKFLPNRWADLRKGDAVKVAVRTSLAGTDPAVGLRLGAAAPDAVALSDLQALAADPGKAPGVRRDAVLLAGKLRTADAVTFLAGLVVDGDLSGPAVQALGNAVAGSDAVSKQALGTLEKLVADAAAPAPRREEAVRALAGSRAGTGFLLGLRERAEFPKELVAAAGPVLRGSPFQGERNKAIILFPAAGTLDPAKLPTPAELSKKTGDITRGKAILLKSKTSEVQCLKCHMVNKDGGQIGPDLSLIGKKASVENLLESILHPSKAIADQYASWTVQTADGQTVTGLLVAESESTLTIRDANGKDYAVPLKEVEKRTKSLVSLMPEDLVRTLTEQELLDLVAYLATLKE